MKKLPFLMLGEVFWENVALLVVFRPVALQVALLEKPLAGSATTDRV